MTKMRQADTKPRSKKEGAKIVTTSTNGNGDKPGHSNKTAYMVIRNGRPYFYETVNRWDKKKKKIITTKVYLGTSLPKGYRLVK